MIITLPKHRTRQEMTEARMIANSEAGINCPDCNSLDCEEYPTKAVTPTMICNECGCVTHVVHFIEK
jgi:Zn ribbon nucleic-acid-binding protein